MKPSIGRIVHYVNGARHYAAMITEVRAGTWGSTAVDLVFFPPLHDGVFDDPIVRRSCVPFDERGMHDTWHWPKREEHFEPHDPPTTNTVRP